MIETLDHWSFFDMFELPQHCLRRQIVFENVWFTASIRSFSNVQPKAKDVKLNFESCLRRYVKKNQWWHEYIDKTYHERNETLSGDVKSSYFGSSLIILLGFIQT